MPAGPHAVGFRVIWIDATGPGSTAPSPNRACDRRLRVLLWYPSAIVGHAVKATLATYVAATRSPPSDSSAPVGGSTVWEAADSRAFVRDSATVAQVNDFATAPLDAREIGLMLATPAMAVPRAAPARGRYHLVLLGNGLGPPFFIHWALGEYLAGRGYTVAALGGAICEEPRQLDLSGVAAISRDMNVVVKKLTALSDVDPARIGLVGWSVGGLAQAFMAVTNTNVRALVSLDGAMGYEYGRQLLDSATWIEQTHFTTPFAHLTGDATPQRVVAKSFAFYDSITRGPAYLLHFRPLSHAQFTSLGVLAAQSLKSPDPRPVTKAYAAVAQYTAWFLDAYVRGDRAAAAQLGCPWEPLNLTHADLSLERH